ncbi:MAG: class I SAM-dependent methyltransferase [Burkholderiaceae bacterium]
MHGTGDPSPWVQRFSPLVPRGARVLDVACGAGRHSRWFAARGASVVAIDRDPAALDFLNVSLVQDPVAGSVQTLCADIENSLWPLPGERFDAIVITHYLWRPLWPQFRASLRPGGLLLVETFALGHGRFGRPRNPDFLLQPGELLDAAHGLHILAYEDGLMGDPNQRIQRLAACDAAQRGLEERGDWPLNPG